MGWVGGSMERNGEEHLSGRGCREAKHKDEAEIWGHGNRLEGRLEGLAPGVDERGQKAPAGRQLFSKFWAL